MNQVSAKMKQTAGASGGGEDKKLKKNIEYLLIYVRDKDGDGGFIKPLAKPFTGNRADLPGATH